MAAQIKSNQGASSTLFNHSRPNNPKTSDFDYSAQNNFTADVGMIIPFDYFPTLPGEDIDIDFEMILDTLPLVLPSITQYKVVTHWYYMKRRDLWKGWKTFSTKGRTGNIEKLIPRLDRNLPFSIPEKVSDYGNLYGLSYPYIDSPDSLPSKDWFDDYVLTDGNLKCYADGYHSLASFLGCPPYRNGVIRKSGDFKVTFGHYLPYSFVQDGPIGGRDAVSTVVLGADDLTSELTGHNFYRYVNALPFAMYQSIVKNNYVNQNLLQDNLALFPEQGDDDWILPYNASHDGINYIGKGEEKNADVNDDNTSASGVYRSTDKRVRLDCLRYAQYQEDYFTTGLPWLQRGEAETLNSEFSLDDLVSTFDFSDSVHGSDVGSDSNTAVYVDRNDSQFLTSSMADNHLILEALNKGKLSALSGTLQSSITANQLRELIAVSVWQERNARVNGSYNSMIYQHWLTNPHSEEHKPVYIGGTVDFISFTSVLQTSESTESSPLASQGGLGRSNGQSRVGHIRSDDYGYVMGIMIIYPTTTYSQGISHDLSCENIFDDFVQPEFEGLSPQPILNKELFISDDDDVNDDLFAYQERYIYLKVRQNQNKGMFYASPEKDRLFSAMTQSRWFDTTPQLSYQFLCMSPDNVRRDWLAYPEYPAFRIQTASKVRINNRHLSYASQPETFGF